MKLSVTVRLPVDCEALLLDDNVSYRPDLAVKGQHAMRSMLQSWQPDVLITGEVPDPSTLAEWRAAVPAERRLAILHLTDSVASSAEDPSHGIAGIDCERLGRASSQHPEIDAFVRAEALCHRQFAVPRRASTKPAARRVIMIGSGAVNLVTAYELQREGYQVEIFDAGPDPAQRYDWRKHGCTFGGGDARIFSVNESRHHHHKGHVVHALTNTEFQRTIIEDGWLACQTRSLGERDRQWISEHEAMPQWLSGRFQADIISFNQASHAWWRQLMADAPQLFSDVGFHDGLLRLYCTPEKYERSKASERNLGAILRELDVSRLASYFPSLAEAADAGQIAGALEVVGFSLNVHRLCRALIAALTERGAAFHWATRVSGLERDDRGRITGVDVGGDTRVADHYVVSAGVYGRELLRGFASYEAIAPVIGMWLALPNTSPKLDRPLKIARSGFASTASTEGVNVIASHDPEYGDVIYVSGGHGYVGIDNEPDEQGMAGLVRAVELTAKQFFPSKFARAVELGMISEHRRYCIRPWTASGLGLFEHAETATGGLAIVTGGHNTGGFAQAPAVARAVVTKLRGEHHPMHTLYHPSRYRSYMGLAPGSARPPAANTERG